MTVAERLGPLRALEAREALSRDGLTQGALVREVIGDRLAAVTEDLFALRAEADAELSPGIAEGGREEGHGGYPIGYCKPIRDHGLARLLSSGADDAGRPAFEAVRAFRRSGGVVKGVWGIQKGRYFQNAIQFGDLCIDLANDTVDPSRPAVELLPMDEAQFEEILSFERYAEVAERYWGCEIYPNRHFPEIAAMYPVLALWPGRGLRLPAPATLAPRNIRLDFRPAETFLGDSAYAGRTLSDGVVEALERWVSGLGEAAPRFLASGADFVHAEAIVTERRSVAALTEKAKLDLFFARGAPFRAPISLSR